MSLKSMALVGMGMVGMLAIEKYGIPAYKKASKASSKAMKNISKKIDQMM